MVRLSGFVELADPAVDCIRTSSHSVLLHKQRDAGQWTAISATVCNLKALFTCDIADWRVQICLRTWAAPVYPSDATL